MSDPNPRKLVDDLQAGLKGNGDGSCQVLLEAVRHHLLKMSDNMELMQFEIGGYRLVKLLRNVRRDGRSE